MEETQTQCEVERDWESGNLLPGTADWTGLGFATWRWLMPLPQPCNAVRRHAFECCGALIFVKATGWLRWQLISNLASVQR